MYNRYASLAQGLLTEVEPVFVYKIGLVEAHDMWSCYQLAIKLLQLPVEDSIRIGWSDFICCIQHVHKGSGALDMTQELMPKPGTIRRPFY